MELCCLLCWWTSKCLIVMLGLKTRCWCWIFRTMCCCLCSDLVCMRQLVHRTTEVVIICPKVCGNPVSRIFSSFHLDSSGKDFLVAIDFNLHAPKYPPLLSMPPFPCIVYWVRTQLHDQDPQLRMNSKCLLTCCLWIIISGLFQEAQYAVETKAIIEKVH